MSKQTRLCNGATRVSEQWTRSFRPEDLMLNARPREHFPPWHMSVAEWRTDQKQVSFSQETTGPFCCVMPTTPELAINVDAVVVQLLSHVQLFVTPWAAAHQASPSFTISWSVFKLMFIQSVMPSNHLILCCHFSSCPHYFQASWSFPVSHLFALGAQNSGASASVLPMSIQGWFLLGLTGLISLLFKRLSRVFSSTTVQKYQFLSAQPFLLSSSHIHT